MTVGAITTAVVAGSATGVLAAPASAPVAEVAVDQTLAPVLHGKATAAGSGTQSIRFSARTVGATSWDLLNAVAVAGTDAYRALPEGRLAIGQRFEYQIAHCDSTGCTSSPVKAGAVSPSLGAGERPGGTRLPLTIGDRIDGQVDVGSGNLLLSSTLFSLPRRSGATLDVDLTHNSVTRRGEAHYAGSVGRASSGWRLSTGPDIRLHPVAGTGAVVFSGPDGLTGTFTPKTGGGFTAPAGFKMTLAAVTGGGWTLLDHASGDTHHFDAGGRLTKLTDRNGNPVTFSYTAAGALSSIRTDVGSAGASTLTFTTEGSGRGRITGITQTADTGTVRSVTLAYDANGDLAAMTDPEGRRTEFLHGSTGNLNRVTAPGGAQTSFGYDELGRVQTSTQPTAAAPAGAVTRIRYEASRTLVADPNSDQGVSILDAARSTYQLTGDGRLLVASATDPAGHVRSAAYTPQLDVTTATDPAGTATFGYDPAVNGGESLTSTRSATGAGSAFAYGNTAAATRHLPTAGTDAQGRTSTYTYNGAGNRLSATDASSAQANVTRNTDGTVATSTSPTGAVTSYGYDSLGQLTSVTPPAGTSLGKRTWTYDGYGRLASYTSGRGVTETYSYDKLDRITKVDYSDATTDVTYTYDAAGWDDTRTDASGTTAYDHDPLGRLTAHSNTADGGQVHRYTYDPAGNLTGTTGPEGALAYSYDTRNLPTAVTVDVGPTIGFAHDTTGRRTDTWYETNTARTSFAAHTHTDYDASSRVTRVWTSRAGNDADRVSDLSYSYASPGPAACADAPATGADTDLRWKQTDNRTGKVTTYCYDRANRLVAATTPGGDSFTYTYDTGGNRTQATKNGTVVQTLTVNPGDQITTAGYAYDRSGNITAAPAVGSGAGYNGAEQMTTRDGISYRYAGTDQVELTAQTGGLDYPGQRSYSYGRTDANGLPLVETITTDPGRTGYIYDPQGTPLALYTPYGDAYYLALDGLGSPVAALDHTGTLAGSYTYDPYGQSTATAHNGHDAIDFQIYGFAGGLDDPTSGLMHYGHRWYDPTTGRFTQQDALETLADPTRANRYEYANSNPINYIDPTGLVCTAVPDGYGRVSFVPACTNHDACYAGDSPRSTCDFVFRLQLERACATEYRSYAERSSRRLCFNRARTYYYGVRLAGWLFD